MLINYLNGKIYLVFIYAKLTVADSITAAMNKIQKWFNNIKCIK